MVCLNARRRKSTRVNAALSVCVDVRYVNVSLAFLASTSCVHSMSALTASQFMHGIRNNEPLPIYSICHFVRPSDKDVDSLVILLRTPHHIHQCAISLTAFSIHTHLCWNESLYFIIRTANSFNLFWAILITVLSFLWPHIIMRIRTETSMGYCWPSLIGWHQREGALDLTAGCPLLELWKCEMRLFQFCRLMKHISFSSGDCHSFLVGGTDGRAETL